MNRLVSIGEPAGRISLQELEDLWNLQRLVADMRKVYKRRYRDIADRQDAGWLIEEGPVRPLAIVRKMPGKHNESPPRKDGTRY